MIRRRWVQAVQCGHVVLLSRGSDPLHAHARGVHSKGLEIVDICRERGSIRLREGDNDCVNSRTATGLPAQQRSASHERLGKVLHDVARHQEAVRKGVATGVTLQGQVSADSGYVYGGCASSRSRDVFRFPRCCATRSSSPSR